MSRKKASKPDAQELTRYYKILKNGRSCNGGKMTWSLPKDGVPGKWHEVAGELVRCQNGLHLTSEPSYHLGRHEPLLACYLAEYEGETAGPFGGDELVCRRVRLVRHVPREELMVDGDGVIPQPPPPPPEKSPAYQLLAHVWKHEGHGMGKSWARINGAMQTALRLAIDCGMRFDREDFAGFVKDFNSGYWIGDSEGYYARACAHGANPSAYQSYEHWRGRKPFIVLETASESATKVRLCVGQKFEWHVKLKSKVRVKVTSFSDGGEKPHVVACSYKPKTSGVYSPDKIDRRFTITHDDIAEYHKAIQDFSRKQAKKSENADVA